MTDVTVDMGGVLDAMYDLGASTQDMRSGFRAGLSYLKGYMTAYPPQSSRPQPFRTDRQRRGFFAKLKSGEIEVPYRRGTSPGSRQLSKSWQISVSTLQGELGTRVPYAPLVQSRPDQTRYHKATGWTTAEDVQERHGERAAEIVQETVMARIRGGK